MYNIVVRGAVAGATGDHGHAAGEVVRRADLGGGADGDGPQEREEEEEGKAGRHLQVGCTSLQVYCGVTHLLGKTSCWIGFGMLRHPA